MMEQANQSATTDTKLNERLFAPEVQAYIAAQLDTPLEKIALRGAYFEGITLQEISTQVAGKQKCIEKIPLWGRTTGIYYPTKLSIEQTSSEATAKYKASLTTGTLLDATGGLGVDSFYFSQKCSQVTHCELQEELSSIARHNFRVLGAENIRPVCANAIDFLENNHHSYDCIYLDPARRHDAQKIIALEACLPNPVALLPKLWRHTQRVMLKASPMLDISKAIGLLQGVKEVHIVSLLEEVKELLFVITPTPCTTPQCIAISLDRNGTILHRFAFKWGSSPQKETKISSVKAYLYQPHAALMKSGGFNQISAHYGIEKLGQDTHLFTSDKEINDFFGRKLKVAQVLPLHQAKKEILGLKARVVERNFPMSVAQIRQRWQIKEGEELHLYFTTDENKKKIVIFCTD